MMGGKKMTLLKHKAKLVTAITAVLVLAIAENAGFQFSAFARRGYNIFRALFHSPSK
jgi:hypothetical protein